MENPSTHIDVMNTYKFLVTLNIHWTFQIIFSRRHETALQKFAIFHTFVNLSDR